MAEPQTIPDIIAYHRQCAKEILGNGVYEDILEKEEAEDAALDHEEEADRIEAAYKRELGNAQKMRKALEQLVSWLDKQVAGAKKCDKCPFKGKTWRGEPCFWHVDCGIEEYDVENRDRAEFILQKFNLRKALSPLKNQAREEK